MNLHEKYFEGKLIGEGYFYKVYIIKDKIKQDFFVVKIAKFSYTSKDHLNYLDEIYHHRQIVITDVAKGMKCLHSVGITHGSLRSSQIMLDENEEPHINEIGFTKIVKTHFSQEYFQSKIAAKEDIFIQRQKFF